MSRLQRLLPSLVSAQVDGLLVTSAKNRRYLSGFTGSAGLLLIKATGEAWLITDFRYGEQARAQAKEFEVLVYDKSIIETILETAVNAGIKTLGFEKANLTFAQYEEFREKLEGINFVPVANLVEKIRAVKEPGEIDLVRQAQELADKAFEHILTYLKPGIRELDVALELEYYMKKRGAEDRAFDFIVASGQRSSLPHGTATDKVLEAGDLVTMDFGAVVEGYHSDITRTVVLGQANDKQKEIYQIVLEAQEAALSFIKPGLDTKELDAVARDIIKAKGYGEYFGHGLGHGVGFDIHEEPSVSHRGNATLEPGMIITIEPGIYLPGWGGVRIEDMAFITEDGFENLTRSPKELLEI